MMKRLKGIVRSKCGLAAVGAVIATLLCLWAVPALAANFTDVYSDTWDNPDYPDAVDALSDLAVITGYSDGTFRPHDLVMRQQFAKMIVKVLQLPVTGDEMCPFADVAAGASSTDPYYPDKYIAVCAACGITAGRTATSFAPYANITRAQVLSMVVRAARQAGVDLQEPSAAYYAGTIANSTLRDLHDPVHGVNVQTAEMNNLVWGIWPDTATTWDVQKNATRGEVALILWRLWQKMNPLETTTTEPETTTTTTQPGPATTTTQPGPATTTTLAGDKTWVDLKPTGSSPSARNNHAMAYDSAADALIMFGGVRDGMGALSDTWKYDLAANTWTRLEPSGAIPAGRWGSAMVYDTDRNEIIMFGGWSTRDNADTWTYDPVADTWASLQSFDTPPAARHSHSMVYDSARARVLLFGGYGVGYLSDLWEYDPAAGVWTELHPAGTSPAARIGQAMVYDSVRDKVILFGGQLIGGVDNDTWEYDRSTNEWTRIYPSGSAPSARFGHTMFFDPVTGRVLLFGGRAAATLGDCWAYDPRSETWSELVLEGSPPSARFGAALAYDPLGRRALIFGGADGEGLYFNDTWELIP